MVKLSPRKKQPVVVEDEFEEEVSETEEEEETESESEEEEKPAKKPAKKANRSKGSKSRFVRANIKKGTEEYKAWWAKVKRIGSKREVLNGKTTYKSKSTGKRRSKSKGVPLRTYSRLTSDDLVKVQLTDKNGNDKVITTTDDEGNVTETPRTRILYKSRHLVGKMIHDYTHKEIKGDKDLNDRIKEVKDYFINESKSGGAGLDKSTMYQTYLALKDITNKASRDKAIAEHNEDVKEKAKQWTETQKAQAGYFDPKGKPKGWTKPLNHKKPRLRGHYSTSGRKGRKCLKNLSTSLECAKKQCDENKKVYSDVKHGSKGTKQGGKKYCASPSKKIEKGRE
jgi:hypothetical protein